MKDLTSRQQEILDFIIDFKDRKDYSPTLDEIADRFGFYKKAASDHVAVLKKKGYITNTERVSRSIRVL